MSRFPILLLSLCFSIQSLAMPHLLEEQSADTTAPRKSTVPKLVLKPIPLTTITLGVLTLDPAKKGWITICNEQNKPWLKIHPDSALISPIAPYSGYPEYENLVFRVVDTGGNFYRVIINEEKGLMGKIAMQTKALQFQTWEQHVLKVFSVDFDAAKNPLKSDTTLKGKTVNGNNVEAFQPVSVNNDWLKVKWETERGDRFGWIRWRRGNKMLVYLNYIP